MYNFFSQHFFLISFKKPEFEKRYYLHVHTVYQLLNNTFFIVNIK